MGSSKLMFYRNELMKNRDRPKLYRLRDVLPIWKGVLVF